MSRRGGSRLSDALPDLVNTVADKAAGLAGISLGVTFLYFVYALFSRYVREYAALAQPERLRVESNLQAAAAIFVAAAAVLVAYTVLRLWEENQLAAGLALVGAVLYFGAPFAVTEILGSAATNNAALIIHQAFAGAGMVVLIAAVARGIPALLSQLREGFRSYGQDSTTQRAVRVQMVGVVHPMSPCWRLPYCRPFIRDRCIRYKERRACWRKKSGCMCDDDIMAAALIGAEGSGGAAREKLILEFLPGAGGKAVAKRRLKCGNCFIYLEHQRIKHRYVAPLVFPAVVLAFWAFLEPIESAYLSLGLWATDALQRIALGQVDTSVLSETFTNPAVKWLILFCVGMYLLTYLLRLLEYLFFKLRI